MCNMYGRLHTSIADYYNTRQRFYKTVMLLEQSYKEGVVQEEGVKN